MADKDPFWITLLDGTTGTGETLDCFRATDVLIEYVWAADVSAGVVALEQAGANDYAGTWANIETKNFLDDGTILTTLAGPKGFIRPRITTTVSGGAAPGLIVRARRLFRS